MYALIEWLNACMRGGLISRKQQEVILLLAAGWTDEAVGNKLDISSRTVQRHVSRTMSLVGARSRLELGILLSSRAQSWVLRRARAFALEPVTGPGDIPVPPGFRAAGAISVRLRRG